MSTMPCAATDCPVPDECGGDACQALPGAPAGCPQLPGCDEWGDGHCHAHCWDDGEVINQPDGATCEPCTEDAAYAARARREREYARESA